MTNCLGCTAHHLYEECEEGPDDSCSPPSFAMLVKMEIGPESGAPYDPGGMARLSIIDAWQWHSDASCKEMAMLSYCPSDGANCASESQWYLALDTHSH